MGLAHSPRIVTDGLVLAFDAGNTKSYPGSGTTWTDLMGNTNGTLTNGPTFSSDNGGSIVFDGSDDSVEISSGWTNFGTGTFSIEVWYRPHTAGTFETLVGNIDSGFQLDWDSGNIRFNSSTKVTSTISFVANVWKQVVVVREGTGTDQFKIYSNGDLNTTSTLNVDFNETSQLRLGKSRNGSYRYDGNISVVRIYRGKALTAAEVQQNYNALRGRYGI